MIDNYLKTYIDKYDDWLEKGLIDHSSSVIPVHQSLTEQKQILPSQQAQTFLKQANLIALSSCICRQRHKNCDKPLEVCFILNKAGEKWIEKGLAREISFERGQKILKQTNERGLVHMTIYQPDHEIFALCSCCSCCCHDLQLVLKYDKSYITTKSDYVADDKTDLCIGCGTCVDRCPFSARALEDTLAFNPESCYGCGLCVTTCPEGAISMRPKVI